MREQWGNDQGQAHSDRHRRDLIAQFRKIRAELDAFNPDFVLIWGDDQYENFREDCVPAFSILAYDSVDIQPWKGYRRGRNAWDEPEEQTFTVKGHRAGGKYLATALLKEGIDVAYAYKPLHHPLGHAFANSVLYLDYDRKGFPLPGRALRRERLRALADRRPRRAHVAVGSRAAAGSERSTSIRRRRSRGAASRWAAPSPARCSAARGAWRSSPPRAGAIRSWCRSTR